MQQSSIAYNKCSTINDLIKERLDNKRQREESMDYILDKLRGSDNENSKIISPLIDVVKNYDAFPLLITDIILK
jgi:hypothetical protein